MKRVACLIVSILAIIVFSSVAYAESWLQDSKGWKYLYDDGTSPKNCWLWIDSNGDGLYESYCFDKDGYIYISCRTPDGYDVNEDGAWIVGGVVQRKQLNEINVQPQLNIDRSNATTYPSEIGIKMGTSLGNALNILNNKGIRYVAQNNEITYIDKDGLYRTFGFNNYGSCNMIQVSEICLDEATADAEVSAMIQKVSLPLVAHTKTVEKEVYVFQKIITTQTIGIYKYNNFNGTYTVAHAVAVALA